MHPSSWFTILLVSIKMIYRSTKYQILSPCDICTKSNLCNESSFNRFFVYIHFLYLPRNELQLGQLCFTSFKELMQKGIQQKHQTIGRVNNLKKRIRIHAQFLFIFFLTINEAEYYTPRYISFIYKCKLTQHKTIFHTISNLSMRKMLILLKSKISFCSLRQLLKSNNIT